MTTHSVFDKAALLKFETEYDTSLEDKALQTRGQFVKKFARHQLKNLTLSEYVVGHQTASFCNFVESKTRTWASIQGATSRKFGIYFGRSKSDPTKKYRFTKKFGDSTQNAFKSVKTALLDLVQMGEEEFPDFEAIDVNPLTQMFKAKILSLYYPKRFLAVCSSEHLDMLGSILGFPDNLPHCQYQNLLLTSKAGNPITRGWSNPKFMAFLYKTYVNVGLITEQPIEKPRVKRHCRVDFEELQNQWGEIGRAAEAYALEWEKDRLSGAGLENLIDDIEDRRNRPAYGYDFLSYSAESQSRYIEVKSVAKYSEGHRFFLSDNEEKTSRAEEHAGAYYFYLVFFNGKGTPCDLVAILADRLYENAELTSASYMVRFDIRELQ